MDRRVRVPLYVLIILVFTAFAGPALSVFISFRLFDAAFERQRLQTCTEHGAVITVLREAKPLTSAGRGLLATYEQLYYEKNRCESR